MSVSLPLYVSPSNQWSFVAAGAPAAANKNNTGKINSFFGARICFCSNLQRGRLILSVGLRRTDQTSSSEKRAPHPLSRSSHSQPLRAAFEGLLHIIGAAASSCRAANCPSVRGAAPAIAEPRGGTFGFLMWEEPQREEVMPGREK